MSISLEDLTIKEVMQLDGKLITNYQLFDELAYNKNVKTLDDLGVSKKYDGSRWHEIQLYNGKSIEIFSSDR